MAEANNHGGRREGSGRPKGSLGRRSIEAIAEVAERFPQWSPLMHLAIVANDENLDPEIRLEAAKAAAPYCHAKFRPVVGNADELVDLEGRIARVRVEAHADILEERPGLADRLARARARAQDGYIIDATLPGVLDVPDASQVVAPPVAIRASQPVASPSTPQAKAEGSPPSSPPVADWHPPAPYEPILPSREQRQAFVDCDYASLANGLLSSRDE